MTSQLRTGAGVCSSYSCGTQNYTSVLQNAFPLFAERKWLSENKRCSLNLQQIFANPPTDVSDKHTCATATQNEAEQTDAAKDSHTAEGNLYIPAMSFVATEDITGRSECPDNRLPLTFRHRASCILGHVFHCSPENAFYIFNQQIYFII